MGRKLHKTMNISTTTHLLLLLPASERLVNFRFFKRFTSYNDSSLIKGYHFYRLKFARDKPVRTEDESAESSERVLIAIT